MTPTSGSSRRWPGSLVIDVMPLDERVLGFKNHWYKSGMQRRLKRRLGSGLEVHHIDAPHFLASKLAAYSDRGRSDPLASHDLEDVVRVVDGRQEVSAELAASTGELRSYVAEVVRACMRDPYFVEALPEYFDRGERELRVPIVIERLHAIARVE